MKKLVIIVLAYFSLVQTGWASGGYMGAGQIANMQSAYGGWLINMTGANANPDNCAINMAILDPTNASNPQYKELFVVFWTSQITKTQINIYVAGCHAAGYKLVYFVVTG